MTMLACFEIAVHQYGNVRACDSCGAVDAMHIEQFPRQGWCHDFTSEQPWHRQPDLCPRCVAAKAQALPLVQAMNEAVERGSVDVLAWLARLTAERPHLLNPARRTREPVEEAA